MSISLLNNSLTMLGRFFNPKSTTKPILADSVSKPVFYSAMPKHALPRTTPEAQNVPSEVIRAFLEELISDRTLSMHTLTIVRNGSVICEVALKSQDIHIPKYTFSACKSVTSLAIGILIDEGKLTLDEKLTDIFSDETDIISRIRFKDVTVKTLLTMTSCVTFNEPFAILSKDWVKDYLASSVKGEVGVDFHYNSMNTYMLSAIIKKKSGQGLVDYLTPRLFVPLGISDVFWEKCPNGIERGGWGLYMRQEDFAKFAVMLRNDGMYNGKRIVSKEYIKEATSPKAAPPSSCGQFNYGYQIWSGKKENTFLFNGMLGQNVICFRDSGIIIVSNAGNDETFQQSDYFAHISKYFSAPFDKKLHENQEEHNKLTDMVKSLSWYNIKPTEKPVKKRFFDIFKKKPEITVPPLPSECSLLSSIRFTSSDEHANAVGLMPVFLQLIQNNFTKGFDKLEFETKNDAFYMTYTEKACVNRVKIGFTVPEKNDLVFGNEHFWAAVKGKFTVNEDDEKLFVLELAFIETPFTLKLKLFYDKYNTRLLQCETPGIPFIKKSASAFLKDLKDKPIVATAADKINADYIMYKIEKSFAPSVELIYSKKPY